MCKMLLQALQCDPNPNPHPHPNPHPNPSPTPNPRQALQCDHAIGPTYLEHARLAADRALLHVPLRRRATGHLVPPGVEAHCEPARFKVGTGLTLALTLTLAPTQPQPQP